MSARVLTSYRPHRQGLGKMLGEREAEVMEIVWAGGHVTARDVFEEVRNQGSKLAYSTVKTILERLVEKGILRRDLQNNAYVYESLQSKEEFTRSATNEVVDSLLDSFREPALARFINKMEHIDPASLAMLEQFVASHKRT